MKLLHILRYNSSGFSLNSHQIIDEENYSDIPIKDLGYIHYPSSNYITYLSDKKSSCVVRESKLNEVLRLGDFTYFVYFTDLDDLKYHKKQVSVRVLEDIANLEESVQRSIELHNEFLSAELGGSN